MADAWDALVAAREARDSITGRSFYAARAVEAGWPVKAVALAVGVTPTTVYRWLAAEAEEVQGE